MKKHKGEKFVLINIKVTKEEREALIKAACKYSGGNLSAWLRYAGVKCKPFKHIPRR